MGEKKNSLASKWIITVLKKTWLYDVERAKGSGEVFSVIRFWLGNVRSKPEVFLYPWHRRCPSSSSLSCKKL